MTHFGRIAATLPVSDLERALRFYEGVLGMTKTFENGARFAIVKRDAAELHLTVSAEGPRPSNAAHLLVSDAQALHDELVRQGAVIVKALKDADYGMRGFIFADPDGNRIDVGQNL